MGRRTGVRALGPEEFAKADTNKDGVVSPAEAVAYAEKQRLESENVVSNDVEQDEKQEATVESKKSTKKPTNKSTKKSTKKSTLF